MEAKEFVEIVRQKIPTMEELVGKYSKDAAVDIINSWQILERSEVIYLPDDPVFDLLNKYDCSRLELGLINFYERMYEKDDNLTFADFGEDTMIVNLDTGEVQVVDLFNVKKTKFYCSADTDRFLSCLAHYVDYVKDELLGIRANEIDLKMRIERLIEGSGGKKYEEFWMTLFGFRLMI